jgi:hypothetical protein
MTKNNLESKKMLSFHEFCNYFGIDTPFVYIAIVDAYIQYEYDFTYSGYVSPDKYYSKKENEKTKGKKQA